MIDEQTLLFDAPASDDLVFAVAGLPEANPLLAARHYLGPVESGAVRLVVADETLARRNGAAIRAGRYIRPEDR